jgi:hypothetical protein
MNFKLKRIAPLQAGKMLAALYGLLSLLVVPFMLAAVALGSFAAKGQGRAGALPLVFGAGFMICLPFIYALMGFIGGVVGAWVYNLLTKWVGGFEFEFEVPAPPAV